MKHKFDWWPQLDEIYAAGYDNSVGSTDIQGGGSLALGPDGIANLGKWLVNSNSGYLGLDNVDMTEVITIFWIGIGYAEESILLVLYIKFVLPRIKVSIFGIDIHESVVHKALENIKNFNCSDYITVTICDVMSVTTLILLGLCGGKLPNLFYTSAAFSDIFNYKILSLCVVSEASLLCSTGTVNSTKFILKEKARMLVNAYLHGSVESRDIYLIMDPHVDVAKGDILDYVNEYLIEEMTAEMIRSFTFFSSIIIKIENMTALGLVFDHDWNMPLDGTPYQSLMSKIVIDKQILNRTLEVYSESLNDNDRQKAKINLSENIKSVICECVSVEIKNCFDYDRL